MRITARCWSRRCRSGPPELRESGGALSQPDGAGVRLVLGAGREPAFHQGSGPVLEMLGIQGDALAGETKKAQGAGWNEAERAILKAKMAARQPFLDFVYSRAIRWFRQYFQVSGEPMSTGPAALPLSRNRHGRHRTHAPR